MLVNIAADDRNSSDEFALQEVFILATICLKKMEVQYMNSQVSLSLIFYLRVKSIIQMDPIYIFWAFFI